VLAFAKTGGPALLLVRFFLGVGLACGSAAFCDRAALARPMHSLQMLASTPRTSFPTLGTLLTIKPLAISR
jgi:hypothetical protein